MSRSILVVAAHSDDEALGCGGTIARHVAQGDTVCAVFMADGVTSRPQSDSRELEARMKAAENAHSVLGLKQVEYLGLPDNQMDSLPLLSVVQKLEAVIRKISPEVIYTHHHSDLNVDHRITNQAVLTACRPLPGSSVKEIYAFEVLSSTEWSASTSGDFVPNTFVDIEKFLDKKLKAVKAYEAEMRSAPHSRSIEHVEVLAKHRGYSVGLSAAEAFVLIRKIN